MLANALSLLLFWTRANAISDAPVFYQHPCGGDRYQIIVQKMPKHESVAA